VKTASPVRRSYRCADAALLAVNCESEAHWRALAKCLGRPELAYSGDWAAASAAPSDGRLGVLLESLFKEDAAEVWLRRLVANGVPARLDAPANGGAKTPRRSNRDNLSSG
jgi:crotonobetainyl-CoA:carnitine CoA-transferase CaiB-like acyl-CoA transferase